MYFVIRAETAVNRAMKRDEFCEGTRIGSTQAGPERQVRRNQAPVPDGILGPFELLLKASVDRIETQIPSRTVGISYGRY